MLLILIAIICLGIFGAALLLYCDDGYDTRHVLAGMFGVIIEAAAALALLAYAFTTYDWLAAEHKAKIINTEYGTNYTQTDVFWASDVIDTIREIDRKRIEINGDLMREKD